MTKTEDKNQLKGRVLTVKQVAEYLQVDEHTIYRLVKKRKIPAIKVAGQWRFKKDLIDKWLEKGSLNNLNKED